MVLFGKMETVTPMDTVVDNLEEGEVEDGELIDDEELIEDEENKIIESVDKFSLRAKRFGINNANTKTYTNPELERFHKSMGVNKETRTEALHLLGTDNMKTLDVFSYFSGYSPASIEWISDNSCNVVWLDEESCAKAFKNLSIKIKGQNVESDDSDESEESISVEDIRCALPLGIWRKGRSHSLAPQLFIRYATYHDKKGMTPQSIRFFGNNLYNRNIFLDQGDEVSKKIRHETGNPWADIARQWRHFETRVQAPPVMDARDVLAHRERKKPKLLTEVLPIPPPKKEEVDIKPILLASRKMHADIEERKILERNRMRHRSHIDRARAEVDLRERLGRKRKRHYEDSDESPEEEWEEEPLPKEKEDLSLRIEIDNSRGDSDKEWNESKTDGSSDSDEVTARKGASDLRSKLMKKKSKSHEHKHEPSVKSVLRTKYINHSHSGRESFPPLRIEIDNDVYRSSSDEED